MNPVVTNVLGGTYSTTQNSDAVSMARSQGAASSFSFTGSTADAKTALSGAVQVDTITLATKAATAAGDFVVISDQTGGKWAVATNKKDVKTVTLPAKASATGGDYIKFLDTTGASWAVALQKTIAVADIKTVTFPAKAGSTGGDYIKIFDQSGSTWAVALQKSAGVADVQTMTFPTEAGATSRDYLVVYDTTNVAWAVYVDKSGSAAAPTGAIWTAIPSSHKTKANVSSLTTAAQVASAFQTSFNSLTGFSSVVTLDSTANDGTMKFTQVSVGVVTAAVCKNLGDTGAGGITIAHTTTGTNPDSAPTGVLWAGISGAHKTFVNISGATTAANVAALCVSALNALTGFTAKIVLTDNTDGTVTFTQTATGVVSNFVPKTANDGGAGSITVANTTPGTVADSAPTGALWAAVAAGHKVFVDIHTATTATQVAGLVATALSGLVGLSSTITVTNPANGTLVFTSAAFGAVSNYVPKNANDSGAGSITVANTVVGAASPAGTLWSSVASANKAVCDISGTTTAAQVATAVRATLAGLTGISAVLTIGAASGADVPITQVNRGLLSDPTPSNGGETAIGSITVAQTTPGVTSAINVLNNTITITAHGYATGLKGQFTTTGTLPAGLSLITDYFVVKVDANTFKVATSLANALAGTVVDITDQGASGSTNTFTPTALAGGSLKLQQSINKTDWFDISGATASITTSGTAYFNNADLYGQYIRAVFTCTAGQVSISGVFCTKDA